MTNFLEFIEEDISSKKTLLQSMPTTTKANIKKLNEKVDQISEKYAEYKSAIKKYLDVKSKSFYIDEKKNTEELTNVVNNLEHIRFILNPSNTYFEKLGFDTLFFQISNYHNFKFGSLNDIINEFLNKFELAGINLQKEDFDYTCYVNEYMSAFLDVRKSGGGYGTVSEIFEKIYWVNPEIISHTELNFRKLIKKYEKSFIDYINKLKQNILVENNFTYEICLEKLKVSYRDLEAASNENITDIIELASSGEIEVNNYFEDSKFRAATFQSLMIDPINLDDPDVADKFYGNLEKLKSNAIEYSNYVKFIPLVEDFKNTYVKVSSKIDPKALKQLESQISATESKLDKINRRIFGKPGLFDKKEPDNKTLKMESIKIANELSELYKKFEQEYFKNKILSVLTPTFTVTDLLHLYYSYDYFKKDAIKRVFDIHTYDEIMEISDNFDLFAMNPTNVIIDGVTLSEENNISRIIVNKYRLTNININEEDLGEDVTPLLDRIKMILRVSTIDKSNVSVEKIWFIASVAKIDEQERKSN